jgi:hypothetical protein
MSERKDEKWLDNQLERIVNGTMPAFDAESWKQTHHAEYEALLSRREQSTRGVRRVVLGRRVAALAVAAAVLLAVALLISGPPTAHAPGTPARPVADSASRMMSMMSLRLAYERGGFDALDRQLQDSLDVFRPRSSSLSMQELLNGMNESKNRKG